MNICIPALKKLLPTLVGMTLLVAAGAVSAHDGDRDHDRDEHRFDRHQGHDRVKVGTSVADYIMATWPTLDDTTCGSNCFSLNYATVPASPAPKYWEYTNGIPLM